jgi:hypothetical protein
MHTNATATAAARHRALRSARTTCCRLCCGAFPAYRKRSLPPVTLPLSLRLGPNPSSAASVPALAGARLPRAEVGAE